MENILIVGAHPDDIELGCIGSLMKLKKRREKDCLFSNDKWRKLGKENL